MNGTNKIRHITMYIQNGRNSSKFKGCSPLQNCSRLIGISPAIAHFAYTHRNCDFKKTTVIE